MIFVALMRASIHPANIAPSLQGVSTICREVSISKKGVEDIGREASSTMYK